MHLHNLHAFAYAVRICIPAARRISFGSDDEFNNSSRFSFFLILFCFVLFVFFGIVMDHNSAPLGLNETWYSISPGSTRSESHDGSRLLAPPLEFHRSRPSTTSTPIWIPDHWNSPEWGSITSNRSYLSLSGFFVSPLKSQWINYYYCFCFNLFLLLLLLLLFVPLIMNFETVHDMGAIETFSPSRSGITLIMKTISIILINKPLWAQQKLQIPSRENIYIHKHTHI